MSGGPTFWAGRDIRAVRERSGSVGRIGTLRLRSGEIGGSTTMQVLIVDDEAPDRTFHRRVVLKAVPEAQVEEASGLSAALELAATRRFDLALVDLCLDGRRDAGEKVVRALQKTQCGAIVVISGLDVETFRPLMFSNNVWDYFEKPIDERSLRMVTQRMLLRESTDQAKAWRSTIADLEWDTASLELPQWRGHKVHLSLGEQRVLLALVRSPNVVVAREALYDTYESWQRDARRLRTSLSTSIHQIRKAFVEVDPTFDRIQAVGSAGYRWRT